MLDLWKPTEYNWVNVRIWCRDEEGTEDEMEEEQVEGDGLLMSAGSFHTQTAIDDTQGDIDPEEVLKTYYETYTKEEKTWYRWGH